MNLAFEASAGPTTVGPELRPRVTGHTLTLGFLAVFSCLAVLLLALNSSVYVNLFLLTVTATIGLVAVRRRAGPRLPRDAAVEGFADSLTAVSVSARQQPIRQRRLGLIGHELLQRARAQSKSLTVAVFDFSDLPELKAAFEGEAAMDLGPTIARQLKHLAPRKGVVVRRGPTTFMVLLPNFDAVRTRAAISRVFSRACCVAFPVGKHEMLLVPDFMVQTVHRDTPSVEDVYRMLCTDLIRGQRHEERRQLFTKLERESRTRMAALRAPSAGTFIPHLAARSWG
ncbi:MAG: hypothetical protein M3150_04725 [Pseudomonadota bacterium]|nr:hypothetical protein [Pseudomonadota bacterium]